MYKRILEQYLIDTASHFPIVSVTGPRQSGKTTLCQMAFPHFEYINLEDEQSRMMVEANPAGYLRAHSHGLIIDEAQHLPRIFPALQVVCDEDDTRRYVISGSSNWLLMSHIGQSLAGRVAPVRLLPLSISEIGSTDAVATDELLLRGFYPAVWGKGRPAPMVYDAYFSTYVQRDVLQIMNIRDMTLFRKFVRLCATRVGSEFVASHLASEVGVSLKTVQGWLSALEASYVVFLLQPYYSNIGKRLSKTPKLYFHDVGLACHLLGLNSADEVARSPLRGALFENMVVADALKQYYNRGVEPPVYFYRDKSQHEVDLVVERPEGLYLYEIKLASAIGGDFYRNTNYLRKIIPQVCHSQVIYDGTEEWDKPDNGFVNFRHVEMP